MIAVLAAVYNFVREAGSIEFWALLSNKIVPSVLSRIEIPYPVEKSRLLNWLVIRFSIAVLSPFTYFDGSKTELANSLFSTAVLGKGCKAASKARARISEIFFVLITQY